LRDDAKRLASSSSELSSSDFAAAGALCLGACSGSWKVRRGRFSSGSMPLAALPAPCGVGSAAARAARTSVPVGAAPASSSSSPSESLP
jgi:hypothetical protein